MARAALPSAAEMIRDQGAGGCLSAGGRVRRTIGEAVSATRAMAGTLGRQRLCADNAKDCIAAASTRTGSGTIAPRRQW